MSAFRTSGSANMIMLPKKASTAFSAGGFVAQDSTNGDVKPATSTDSLILGVGMETVASTDGDYSSARPMLVDAANQDSIFIVDVSNTLTSAMVGQFLKLADATHADAGTATATPGAALVLLCVGFISATQGYFKINGSAYVRGAQ